jgi:hypothetical protein
MFEITLQHYSEVTIRTRMVSEGNFRYLPKYGKNKNYEFQKLRTEHGGFHNLTSKKVLFMSDCKTYLKNNFQSRLMPAFLEEKKKVLDMLCTLLKSIATSSKYYYFKRLYF